MPKILSSEALIKVSTLEIIDIPNPFEDIILTRLSVALNNIVPKFCEPVEMVETGIVSINLDPIRLVVSASKPNLKTKLPTVLFFGAGIEYDDLDIFGTIMGPQSEGVPFVGYIETRPDRRRSGLAAKILPILNEVSKTVYSLPLTAGPGSYLNDDGMALLTSIASRGNLQVNDLGYITGR